ncbi:MAG: DUF2849 domain-containing protein [bacterium]|nr:DUF2849 domain-containing protein [bacterium]
MSRPHHGEREHNDTTEDIPLLQFGERKRKETAAAAAKKAAREEAIQAYGRAYDMLDDTGMSPEKIRERLREEGLTIPEEFTPPAQPPDEKIH